MYSIANCEDCPLEKGGLLRCGVFYRRMCEAMKMNGALRTYDEFKPRREAIAIAAECVRKGDRLSVEAGNCIKRLHGRVAELEAMKVAADFDREVLSRALEVVRKYTDCDFRTNEGPTVGGIIDAAIRNWAEQLKESGK